MIWGFGIEILNLSDEIPESQSQIPDSSRGPNSKDIQPGTEPGDDHHHISTTVWYEDYKPFHDRWELQLERERKLNSLL